MKIHHALAAFLAVAVYGGSLSAQMSKLNPIAEPNAKEFAETFQKGPGRDFSSGPLWTWNDRLTEDQIRGTLRDLASQNVKQVWVHPRPGLMTPYLTDEWFDRWKESLDEAKKLDMNVWIYDENSYPSGFAGGLVPDAMPESRGLGLNFREVKSLDNLDANVWYVYKIEADGSVKNVTEQAKKDGKLAEGNWIVATISEAGSSPWFGDKYYVDLLKKGVTEKFIEITFEAYKREVGSMFGEGGDKRVPGIFTDEPHLQTAGGITWNDEIPDLFQEKYGYSLVDSAVSLIRPVGDWRKVRHDYQRLLLDLFVDRWAKPCFEWCEANNLQFTGHYWEHGWPWASHGPDNMAMYIWHQRPAIDILMNQYSEGVGGQFGNVRSVKEASSVLNQLGHSRSLCELYGAGGWDLRFEDMKRQADWLQVLGVNTINEHISYVTLRGARKRDHPQSFSYHASWWEGYHVMANRNTRLQYALSQGKQVNRILVIEPTTTAWMYQGEAKLGEIGNSFQNFVNALEKANVEYDLGSEDIIERLGTAGRGGLVVGKAVYDVIILPPNMENIDSKTLNLLARAARGKVKVYYFEQPKYVEGTTPSDNDAQRLNQLFGSSRATKVEFDQVIRLCKIRGASDGLRVVPDKEPESGQVYHHRRRLGDKEVVFLSNISITEPATGWVFSKKGDVEKWCPDTGKQWRYPYELSGHENIKFRYELPPCGSLLVVLSSGNRTGYAVETKTETVIPPKTDPVIKRVEPNVLTLDYVDVTAKGETLKGVYFHKANHWVFEKNGSEIGLKRNPWDNGVQFKDELITKKFPEDSGFTATYRFTVEDRGQTTEDRKALLSSLCLVVERADLYEITCNGKPIKVDTSKWWLDKAFYKLDLPDAAKVGENEVSITAKPMTIYHELEPAYLLGDFSLESAEHGFVVCPPKPLQLRTPEPQDPSEPAHSAEIEHVSWLSKGIGHYGENPQAGDNAPFVIFDLGAEYELGTAKIWNYNEVNMTNRGVKECAFVALDKIDDLAYGGFELGHFTLDRAPGRQCTTTTFPQTVEFKPKKTRYVRLNVSSNQNGITFPVNMQTLTGGSPKDNAFVGLSEIRFSTKDGKPIENVKVVKASSALVGGSFDRKADYLVDGSGLGDAKPEQGWNNQGMPFYAYGVSYTEKFDLPAKADGEKICVKLPDSPDGWYGSVAKVIVNGKDAGYIGWAPWKLDVSEFVTPGENTVDVVVIGTPKNLLGPHHGGKTRGTAWPGMFWGAPEPQPPGEAYDTIGYGLFEKFELVITN